MKNITRHKIFGLLSNPLYFSLFVGVISGTLIYHVGRSTFNNVRKIEVKDLEILSRDMAQVYLISLKGDPHLKNRSFLDSALSRVSQHPRIISAMVYSPRNEIIGIAHNPRKSPSIKAAEMTHLIKGPDGEPLGIVMFTLSREFATYPYYFLTQVAWKAFLGFGLCFVASWIFVKKKNSFLSDLVRAFEKVAAGNFELGPLPVTNKETGDVSRVFTQMLEGLRERDRMRHSLGRIMDPKIAEILIKENPRVGGLNRQATILFCDMRNYTSICEQLSPDELQEFLNDYWKGTVDIIMEQEGTIDKFHGDGVCVVFGAPTLHLDDPIRALRTAWKLITNVHKINIKRESQRKTPIQIGIGIHTGEVIAGHIGSERRMDYTVVGDVVNVAARIEELNKKFGTEILISDSVYEKVEDHVHVKTLTLAHLRGHKRPILVHSVREFYDNDLQQQNRLAA